MNDHEAATLQERVEIAQLRSVELDNQRLILTRAQGEFIAHPSATNWKNLEAAMLSYQDIFQEHEEADTRLTDWLWRLDSEYK